MSEALIQTDSVSHKRNLSRVERDEAELKELLKQAGVTQDEQEQEETPQAEPDSSQPSEPQVQAESSTQQEEKPEAKAQEPTTELSSEEKTFKQRYSDIRRHMQDKEQEWKIKFEKLEQQLNAAAKNELVLPKSDQEIEAWAKKYPDVAGIVETIAAKKAQEMFKKAEDRLSQLDEIQYEAERKTAEAKISESHPDFSKLRESDSFHQWAEEQPKWVRDALYENMDDPDSVVRVIDLYKIDTGHTTQDKKAKTKAAAKPIGRGSRTQVDPSEGGSVIRESDVNKMSSAEFEAREEEISKAMRTGKFVYDLTGSARQVLTNTFTCI